MWALVTLYWVGNTVYRMVLGESWWLHALLALLCAVLTRSVRRSELGGWR